MRKLFLTTLLVLRAEAEKRIQGWTRGTTHALRPRRLHRTGLNVAPCEFCCRCDGCGCEFPPMPDSFILTGFTRIAAEEPDNEIFLSRQELLTRAQLEALSEFELSERGLTEEDRQTLLRGEAVYTGADAFCPACLCQIFS